MLASALRTSLRTSTRTPLSRNFTVSAAKMSVQKLNSHAEFQQLIASDKVTVIDFWATWCGPCKMISPIFERIASTVGDKIQFAKVDVDEQEQISQECGIKAMPTFIFFQNGNKVESVVGADPAKLQAAISKYSS